MKNSPQTIGLFQALGVLAYILLFTFAVQTVVDSGFEPSPPMGMIFGLLAFSVSALICGLIVFLYPAQLFFGEHKAQAVKIVIWTAVWLAVFLMTFGFYVLA